MGYYTRFELELNSIATSTENIIPELLECCEDARYALDVIGSSEESAKWYSCDEDIKRFSKKHPSVLFTLSGEGEESGDIWRTYTRNGLMQSAKAEIVIEEFDEKKLK